MSTEIIGFLTKRSNKPHFLMVYRPILRRLTAYKISSDLSMRKKRGNFRVQELALIDNNFMAVAFQDNVEAAQLLVDILLKGRGITVKEAISEYTLGSLHGRGVRLDILGRCANGKLCDIEVQRSNKAAPPKRFRYNSAMLDANVTLPGDDFKKLPETYVVFITEHDYFGDGEPIYYVDRMVHGSHRIFNDEAHIVIANGDYNANDDVGHLMHDFKSLTSKGMYYPVLAEMVHKHKETEEGIDIMCAAFQKVADDAAAEAAAKATAEATAKAIRAARQKEISIVSNLLDKGFTFDEAVETAEVSEVPLDELRKLLLPA